MRSGQWRDLVDVGDAALRGGDVPEFSETAPGDADPESQERLQAFTRRFRVVAGTH